jgi:hypothetical protein
MRALSYVAGPVLLTIGLVIVLGAGVLPPGRAVAIWLLCLAALLLSRFVRELRTADEHGTPRRFDALLRVPRAPKAGVPGELLRVEREIVLGVANAGDAHKRLLPLLRSAAAARLSARHGIDLARRPDDAQVRLGDEAWELLRPDRPEPRDRHDRGVPRDALARVIAQVEGL